MDDSGFGDDTVVGAATSVQFSVSGLRAYKRPEFWGLGFRPY